MADLRATFAAFVRPHGRIGRRRYALSLAAVVLGGSLSVNLGPLGLLVFAVAVWTFICLSAQRLHDIRLPGRLAIAPPLAYAGLIVAYTYLNLVTKGFCQGYCASATPRDIAALTWVEAEGLKVVGLSCLAFVGLLTVLPGRNDSLHKVVGSGARRSS